MARELCFLLLLSLSVACSTDSQCERQYECVGGSCEHKALWPLSLWDVVGSVALLIFLACGFAAGIGGGITVFLIYRLIFNFEPHRGIPLVIASAVIGCLVSYLQRCCVRRPQTSKPVTDYEVAMLCFPPLSLGICYGVRLNQASPQWLLVALVTMLLGYTTWKTYRLGISLYRTELSKQTTLLSQATNAHEPLFPPGPLALILLEFLLYLSFNLLIGGKSASSLIGVERCSKMYWVLFAGYNVLVVSFTLVVGRHLLRSHDSAFEWTRRSVVQLSMYGFLSGLFGSMVLMGPGMLLGPVLLSFGTDPTVVSATGLFMVVLSASSSTLQYSIAGLVDVPYAIFLAVVSGLASLLGISIIKFVVKKYKRTSVIVLTLAGLAGVSFILVPIYDGFELSASIENGTFQGGFNAFCS